MESGALWTREGQSGLGVGEQARVQGGIGGREQEMAIPIPWNVQHRRQGRGGDIGIEERWMEDKKEEKRYKERHWCVLSVMLPETVQYSAEEKCRHSLLYI